MRREGEVGAGGEGAGRGARGGLEAEVLRRALSCAFRASAAAREAAAFMPRQNSGAGAVDGIEVRKPFRHACFLLPTSKAENIIERACGHPPGKSASCSRNGAGCKGKENSAN